MELFDRRLRLDIGPAGQTGRRYEYDATRAGLDFRVMFMVEASARSEPNSARVQVYNLNEASRQYCEGKGLRLILSAGYAEGLTTIYSGDLQLARSRREGPTWITEMECSDGGAALQTATIYESMGAGTTLEEVADRLIAALGLPRGTVTGLEGVTFANGITFAGLVRTNADKVFKPRGIAWSVQNGVVQIHPRLQSVGPMGPTLAPGTGLVGSPTRRTEEDGQTRVKTQVVEVKSFLQGGIWPGGRIRVQCESIKDAVYKVRRAIHSGDTHGQEWYSELECLA